MSFSFPVVLMAAGATPQDPASILAQLLSYVASVEPGYTANLPGSLVEDISSTDVGAVVLIDRARVELLNSLTPAGANAFLLNQLGQIYGTVLGQPFNTSVNVVFTGTVGFVISPGFQVGDGSQTYQVVDGGIVNSTGSSDALTAVAVNAAFLGPVPANSVTIILTSLPGGVTLAVTNPVAGTPAQGTETEQSYRARTLAAGLASSQGVPSYLKTQLLQVPGVVARQVAVQATLGSGIKVIVGGGDTLDVANAIFRGWFDPAHLLGHTAGGSTVTATVNNPPDSYAIVYVAPAAATITLNLTWNTNLANFTQGAAVDQVAVQPLADYINSIPVGNPINLLELNDTFAAAVAGILPEANISKLVWVVTINGTPTSPTFNLYPIDLEEYPEIALTDITIAQG